MKLMRIGAPGQERPAILHEDGTRRDLSSVVDDISGAGQTRAAHDLCTGIPNARREHYDVVGAGHYGIFSGRRWREQAYPRIRDFILSHNAAPKTARRQERAAAA